MKLTQTEPKERFWSKVKIGQRDECWLWDGPTRGNGYGAYRRGYSHRTAWEITNGPIPPGMLVCHKCDNPPCCNPRHLFLGTDKTNSDDKFAKGRENIPKGEQSAVAKLTESQVLQIIADPRKYPVIAAAYGVRPSTISGIKNRQKWRHITNGHTIIKCPPDKYGRKLSAADVLKILADTRTQVQIAATYGVGQRTISRIRNRRIWKHIHETN